MHCSSYTVVTAAKAGEAVAVAAVVAAVAAAVEAAVAEVSLLVNEAKIPV